MKKIIFENIKNNRIEEDNEITNNSDNNLNNLQQLKRPDLKGREILEFKISVGYWMV